jgi:hypothetical protein
VRWWEVHTPSTGIISDGRKLPGFPKWLGADIENPARAEQMHSHKPPSRWLGLAESTQVPSLTFAPDFLSSRTMDTGQESGQHLKNRMERG